MIEACGSSHRPSGAHPHTTLGSKPEPCQPRKKPITNEVRFILCSFKTYLTGAHGGGSLGSYDNKDSMKAILSHQPEILNPKPLSLTIPTSQTKARVSESLLDPDHGASSPPASSLVRLGFKVSSFGLGL